VVARQLLGKQREIFQGSREKTHVIERA